MRILLTILLYSISPLALFSQNWNTIQSFGGTNNESLDALHIIENGNIILAGSFENDIEIAITSLSSTGQEDIFCAIYEGEDLLNAFSMGGNFEEQLAGVTSFGNKITLYGSYNIAADFDTISLNTSIGSKGLFLTQYNLQGEVQWAKSIDGNILSISGGIASDSDGNIVINGYFFDTLIIDTDTLIANSDEGDLFTIKLDNDGDLLWKNQAGNDGIMRATGVAIDTEDNIIIAGKYKGEATFNDNTIQTNTADHDVFVAKMDANGNFIWGKKLGGVFEDDFGDLAIDNDGNIYLTGYFLGVMSSNDSWEIQGNGINRNIYIIQLNSDGEVNWGHSLGGTQDDFATSIATNNNQVAITGYFQDDTNISSFEWNAEDIFDAYIAIFDLSGNILNAIPISGSDFEIGSQITYDNEERIITGGAFNNTCWFDDNEIASNGSYDIYWATASLNVSTEDLPFIENLSFYPNPTSNYIYWNNDESIQISLYDILGKKVSTSNTRKMDIRHLSNGIYFIKIDNYSNIEKIIIQHANP
ncbi:MAG: hypothetical protein ACI94Y_003966 [Maribacter sp.]|jgi:hypothetical protein